MARITKIVLNKFPDDVRVRREAVALARNGHHIRVLAYSEEGKPVREEIEANISVFRYLSRPLPGRSSAATYIIRYILEVIQLFFVLMRHQMLRVADIIHVHNPPDFLIFPVHVVSRISHSRIVLDRHEPFALSVISELGLKENSLVHAVLRTLEIMCCRLANGVVSINRIDESYIRRNVKCPVAVVGNGFDERTLNHVLGGDNCLDPGSLMRERLSIPSETTLLLYQGLLSRKRDLMTVLTAIQSEYLRSYHLLLLGEGPLTAELKQHVIELSLTDQVTIHDPVPVTQVGQFIEAADICLVLASNIPVYRLYTPNKIYEYLAWKKRTVLPRLQNVQSISQNRLPLYEPGDSSSLVSAILEVGKVSEARMKTTAAQILEENSWTQDSERLFELYSRMLGVE